VLFGVQTYKSYWILPVLYSAPIWLFAHIKRAGDFPVAIRAYAAVVIVFIVAVAAGRFVEWRMEIESCDEGGCRPYAPIGEWAAELRERGFAQATIVGADRHLTGNLRGALPRARVLDASISPEAFPAARFNGDCLAVWRDTEFNEERNVAIMPRELEVYLNEKLGAEPRDAGAEDAIRRNLRLSDDKAATLYLQVVPRSEACR
jgi:hypothetical protein